MKIIVYLHLAICKGLLPCCPWIFFIYVFFFSKRPSSIFAFLTTLTTPLCYSSLMKGQWRLSPELYNSRFSPELFPLKPLNKSTIWLLFWFWNILIQILKLNIYIFFFPEEGLRVVFYRIDLIKSQTQLISLKLIFMYLYSMRHYRHINLKLELIPFNRIIWIGLQWLHWNSCGHN